MVMLLGRRRTTLACILAVPVVFLLLTFFWQGDVTEFFIPDTASSGSISVNNGSTGSNASFVETDDDPNFPWRKLRVHYPVTSMSPLPTDKPLHLPPIQRVFPGETPEEVQTRLERQAAVKAVFTRCWESYKKLAWTSDELTPISGGARDTFGGWGATLVDSLDTLWIMGMRDEFALAVDAAVNISFETTTLQEINVFETNIRYLGGYLAAYDLSGDGRLLRKAKEVGDMLYAAFDTPNRMPITRWKLHDAARGAKQVADSNVLLAELGSFSMEFTRLSLLTGDPKWFDAAQRIAEVLAEQQDSTRLPGMWPLVVNAKEAMLNQHNAFTLGAMADSAYEYLPKTYALSGGLMPAYKSMYEKATATAMKYNFFRPVVPDEKDILVSAMVNVHSNGGKPNLELDPEGQHLVCFAGGMLAIGSKLFGLPEHLAAAQKLVDGCVWAYQALPLGIMPETFRMLPCPADGFSCAWSEEAWKKEVLRKHEKETGDANAADPIIAAERLPKGFTRIGDTRYILRPEAIESVFVLYRVTGRKDLLESAWTMFQTIEKNTRTELANAALSDVTATDGGKTDSMESFWMGETLKYFYLVFSEPSLISLDEFVFNTEAHPFKRLAPDK
jgi:mannosyl-oligosaccharide alpha-1,2-mannosidase